MQALEHPGAFAVKTCPVSFGTSFWFDLLSRLINIYYGMRGLEVKTG
jgi:hypothetical protein